MAMDLLIINTIKFKKGAKATLVNEGTTGIYTLGGLVEIQAGKICVLPFIAKNSEESGRYRLSFLSGDSFSGMRISYPKGVIRSIIQLEDKNWNGSDRYFTKFPKVLWNMKLIHISTEVLTSKRKVFSFIAIDNMEAIKMVDFELGTCSYTDELSVILMKNPALSMMLRPEESTEDFIKEVLQLYKKYGLRPRYYAGLCQCVYEQNKIWGEATEFWEMYPTIHRYISEKFIAKDSDLADNTPIGNELIFKLMN